MRRVFVVFAWLAASLWVAEPRLDAQNQQQLFVSLTAADGTPVTDLQSGDINVTEDGVACKILKLEPVDWPTKLQVLVDNSEPNTNPINSLRQGLKALFEQMPSGVEMAMYTTSPQPRPIVKATTDRQKLIDGIGLITPDRGAGAFFEALFEAAARVDKEKASLKEKGNQFPVLLMVGSDFGKLNFSDRDYQKLQEQLVKHAMTVHIILMTSRLGSSGGGAQTEIGLALTKLTGGRYDNINATSRLATLLPELGKRIAESHAKQSHQYRVTYERPANANAAPRIGASVGRPGTLSLALDGRIP